MSDSLGISCFRASCLLSEVALEMAYCAETPQESGFPTLTLLQHSALYCAHSFLSWVNLPFIWDWPIIRGNQVLLCLLIWHSPLPFHLCLPHSYLHFHLKCQPAYDCHHTKASEPMRMHWSCKCHKSEIKSLFNRAEWSHSQPYKYKLSL